MRNRVVAQAAGSVFIAAFSAQSAIAQDVFTGTDIAQTRTEDLIEAIEADAERDIDRFGIEGLPQGFSATFALRGVASSGNTDSINVGVGANLNYVTGLNGFELDLNYVYGENDGVQNEESLYYGLQYTRELNPRLYGFGKVQGSVDQFSSFQSDVFVSVGLGYRVINDPVTQWSVQAGPGYRFASLSDVATADVSEAAFGVSSDFSRRLSNTMLLTNDTDIVASDFDTAVLNNLALSVAMTDKLALRTSVQTEYHSNPEPGFDNTDNTFGVSLVYSFN